MLSDLVLKRIIVSCRSLMNIILENLEELSGGLSFWKKGLAEKLEKKFDGHLF